VFAVTDADGDGVLSPSEVSGAFSSVGYDISMVRAVFVSVMTDEDRTFDPSTVDRSLISYPQFVLACAQGLLPTVGVDDLSLYDGLVDLAYNQRVLERFIYFDVDKSGEVSAKEVVSGIARLQIMPSYPQYGSLLAKIMDLEFDGRIPFRVFRRACETSLMPLTSSDADMSKERIAALFNVYRQYQLTQASNLQNYLEVEWKVESKMAQEIASTLDVDGSSDIRTIEFFQAFLKGLIPDSVSAAGALSEYMEAWQKHY
jgi:Ca2+-binding EF-hand superfamily protein